MPDGKQSISREMFVIPLIKAVQELSTKNDALEAKVEELEVKVEELDNPSLEQRVHDIEQRLI